MDMFMDKLAQKLTAQEIIKANTAADTEELNQLKGQVKDYSACLDRLEQLIEEISEKLSGTRSVDGESINRIQAVLEDRLDTMAKALTAQMEIFDKNNNTVMQQEAAQKDFFAQQRELTAQIKSLEEKQQEVLAGLKALTEVHQAAVQKMEKLEEGQQAVSGKIEELERGFAEKLEGLQKEESGAPLDEKIDTMEENVHKECVKVYRNVQAVVMEESAKQKEAVEELDKGVKESGGKMGLILGISIAALIFSLAGTILKVWKNGEGIMETRQYALSAAGCHGEHGR